MLDNLYDREYLTPPDNEAEKVFHCFLCKDWIYEGDRYYLISGLEYCRDCVKEKTAEPYEKRCEICKEEFEGSLKSRKCDNCRYELSQMLKEIPYKERIKILKEKYKKEKKKKLSVSDKLLLFYCSK